MLLKSICGHSKFCVMNRILHFSTVIVKDLSKIYLASNQNCIPFVFLCTHKQYRANRPAGGGRFLKDGDDVFKFNNWDNVEWNEEQEEEAKQKVEKNSSKLVPDDMKEKYETEAGNYWDQFYNQHQNRFFKDRHWLFTEFPELAPDGKISDSTQIKTDEPLPSTSTLSESSNTDTAEKQKSNQDCVMNLLANSNKILVQGVQGDIEEDIENDISLSQLKKIQEAMKEASLTDDEKRDRICQGVQGSVQHSTCDDTSMDNSGQFPGYKAKMRLFEVGCGVGNTVFPVLQTNNDPNLFVYCCDLSDTAIELVKEHADYTPDRCHAFVADVTETDKQMPFPAESLDIIILIFVLSAIHPDKMQETITRLARYLKPGGMIVFRDYGRYDLAQLRFKNGQCLSSNFYVRGDGTRVYFFTQEELRDMFTQAGLTEEVQNHVDRRLQVNRGRQLKMYRVWVQCKYRKPIKLLPR